MNLKGLYDWFANNVVDDLVDTTVKAGIGSLVTGQDFNDSFKQQAVMTLGGELLGAFQNRNKPAQTPPMPPAQLPQRRAPAGNPALRKASGLPPQQSPGFQAPGSLLGLINGSSGANSPYSSSGIGALINQQTAATAPVDSRGFLESIGDTVTGDQDYSRWDSIKQAFLPSAEGNPSALRRYGPLAGLGILAAYKGGAFDPQEMTGPAFDGPSGKELMFKNRGMYRPGVPTIAGKASGGGIHGPGTGTSDDIPAMLSDGEFVMTNKAVEGAGGGNREQGMRTMYNIMHDFEKRAR